MVTLTIIGYLPPADYFDAREITGHVTLRVCEPMMLL